MGDITTNVCEIDFPLKGHNAVVGILDNFLYPRLVKLNSENGLVKYIKALHEAIVSEADFWLAQEMKSPQKPIKNKNKQRLFAKRPVEMQLRKIHDCGMEQGEETILFIL